MRVVLDTNTVVSALLFSGVASQLVPLLQSRRKFLDCAVAGRSKFLVTGDHDLLELRSYRGITILRVGDFLRHLEASGSSAKRS